MEKLTFKNIVPELLKLIPEFVHFKDFKDAQGGLHIPYVIFQAFCRFYLFSYQRGDNEILKRMSDFLEKMAKSKDMGVWKIALIDGFLCKGFLENPDIKENYHAKIIESFGEHTKQVLRDVEKSKEEYENIISELLESIPELTEFEYFKLDKSNQDNQYIVFGIFRNFYLESLQQGKNELIKRMSDFLEEMAKKTESIFIQELLASGFLENFDGQADYYNGLVKTFGENTRKLLKEIAEYWKNHHDLVNKKWWQFW